MLKNKEEEERIKKEYGNTSKKILEIIEKNKKDEEKQKENN